MKIMSLETREQRREALNQVPEHLQGLVRKHVENVYELRKIRGTGKPGG